MTVKSTNFYTWNNKELIYYEIKIHLLYVSSELLSVNLIPRFVSANRMLTNMKSGDEISHQVVRAKFLLHGSQLFCSKVVKVVFQKVVRGNGASIIMDSVKEYNNSYDTALWIRFSEKTGWTER